VQRRAAAVAKKWSRDSRRSGASVAKPRIAAPIPVAPPVPQQVAAVCGSLTVTGPAYSGKTALISTMVGATGANAADKSPIIRLVDAGSIDGNEGHFASVLAAAAATDGVLFVIDQDLRAPEAAAITRLIGSGKPLYVVLNKADQFSAADRDAVLLSIRAKMPPKFAPGHVISVAGAPSPVEREIEDARGAVRLELRRPSSDVLALTNLLNRVFAVAPGQTLKFEAA
jgi:hypothetical protein